MIPLELTSGEQEFLAELCSILRHYKYLHLNKGDLDRNDAEQLFGQVYDILLKWEWLTPQKLDSLYDRLHRTGENS